MKAATTNACGKVKFYYFELELLCCSSHDCILDSCLFIQKLKALPLYICSSHCQMIKMAPHIWADLGNCGDAWGNADKVKVHVQRSRIISKYPVFYFKNLLCSSCCDLTVLELLNWTSLSQVGTGLRYREMLFRGLDEYKYFHWINSKWVEKWRACSVSYMDRAKNTKEEGRVDEKWQYGTTFVFW